MEAEIGPLQAARVHLTAEKGQGSLKEHCPLRKMGGGMKEGTEGVYIARAANLTLVPITHPLSSEWGNACLHLSCPVSLTNEHCEISRLS